MFHKEVVRCFREGIKYFPAFLKTFREGIKCFPALLKTFAEYNRALAEPAKCLQSATETYFSHL